MSDHPAHNTSKVIVIADDLSGAAEVAGIAFAHGLSAEVQRQFDPSSDAQVIAIDTDSRHLSEAEAAERVERIACDVVASRPGWIYKKVDSVLRGNPRVEIEAILRATGQSQAILIPANPSRGRVIAGGRYLIDGLPLDQTQFAHDPDHPRQSADVRALLGPGADSAIVAPDVGSGHELDQFARTVETSTLLAGAADFFTALLRDRCTVQPSAQSAPPSILPPALLVCGSRAAWHERREACLAAGVPVVEIEGWGTGPREFGALLLGVAELAPQHWTLLAFLSQLAAFLVQDSSVKTLLAEGGATAAAIADRLGWTRFAVVATAPAGVGVLRPIGADAPLVLIKPGSYPWPANIWQAFIGCRVA